jgi:hypothetical protein
MSKLLITATSAKSPTQQQLWKEGDGAQVVYVESDKIQIFPREGTAKAVIIANGYQYFVDAEVAELADALGAEDVSAYT